MKKFIITEKSLKNLNVCKEAIDFCKNSNLIGLNYYNLEVLGDFNGYNGWLTSELKIERKYDKNNNIIYKKYPSGRECFWEYKYDKNNNIIYKKNANGREWFYKYNKNSYLVYKKNYDGREYFYKYDKNNNMTYLKYPSGSEWVWEYKYDKNSNILESITKNGKEILRIKIKGVENDKNG